MVVTRALVNAKVRSEKLFSFIIQYFLSIGFQKHQQETLNDNIPIFFYFSLAKAYPSLQDSDEFFDLMNEYLKGRVPTMTLK